MGWWMVSPHRITTKARDVTPQPVKRESLITQGQVPLACLIAKRKDVEPVLNKHGQHWFT